MYGQLWTYEEARKPIERICRALYLVVPVGDYASQRGIFCRMVESMPLGWHNFFGLQRAQTIVQRFSHLRPEQKRQMNTWRWCVYWFRGHSWFWCRAFAVAPDAQVRNARVRCLIDQQ